MDTNELLKQNDELKRQTLEIKGQIEGLLKLNLNSLLEEHGITREEWDKWLKTNVSPALWAEANSKADLQLAEIEREIRSLSSEAASSTPVGRRNRNMV